MSHTRGNQITSLVLDNDLHDVVLAGHGYGGMVIAGTAAQVADRVRGMVYVDAALPDPGQSLFEIIESSGREPLSFPGLEAAPPYVEKLWSDRSRWGTIPKIYVLCTESEVLPVTKIAKAKISDGSASELVLPGASLVAGADGEHARRSGKDPAGSLKAKPGRIGWLTSPSFARVP